MISSCARRKTITIFNIELYLIEAIVVGTRVTSLDNLLLNRKKSFKCSH